MIEITVEDAVSLPEQLAALRLADDRGECQANPVAIVCPLGRPPASGWYAGISLSCSCRTKCQATLGGFREHSADRRQAPQELRETTG